MASTVRGEGRAFGRGADVAGRTSAKSGTRTAMSLAAAVLTAALGIGLYVRILAVGGADFPVNDGGLFWVMIEEIRANGYRLPATTAYNGWGLPFAYPPLGFYLVALLADLTGVSTLTLLRVVPAVVSWLTIPAFFLLARRILGRADTAAVATLAFALLPRTWLWFVMGGGITRSLGFLFTLLLLHRVHRMYTAHDRRDVLLAAILGALAVTSHLENAWFGVYSSVLLLLAYGRNARSLGNALVVAAGVALLTSPWWGSVIGTHGVEPFLRAVGAGGEEEFSLEGLVHFRFTDEPFLAVLGVIGLLGTLVSTVRGRLLLPLWLGVIFLVNPRNPMTPAAVPFAMLVAIGVLSVIAPGLAAAFRGDDAERPAWVPRIGATGATAAVLVALTGYVMLSSRSVAGNSPFLGVLDRGDRTAMAWVAENTPADARTLVVTGSWFGLDATAEWFPALARRQSVATVQASEWLPGKQFYARWMQSDSLRSCITRDVGCVERWAERHGRDYTHLYVRGGGLATVAASAAASPAYELLYRQDSVAIFRRRPGA